MCNTHSYMQQILQRAVKAIGVRTVAKGTGVTRGAVYKWLDEGRLPQTELLGLTAYAVEIEKLSQSTKTPVSASELIACSREAWLQKPPIKRGYCKTKSTPEVNNC